MAVNSPLEWSLMAGGCLISSSSTKTSVYDDSSIVHLNGEVEYGR